MPHFDGVAGRAYFKAWRVPAPRLAALVFLHGFGEHSGLYTGSATPWLPRASSCGPLTRSVTG